MRYFIIGCLLLLLFRLTGQTFQNFIDGLNQLPTNQRQMVVDSFLIENPHSPFTEFDTLAHFFYTGNVQSISVPGDATGWDPGENTMTHIDGTNFWYFTGIYENDARLDYKYVTNGSNWILDPRNPNTVNGGFGPNSELAMPAYVQPPEIEYYPSLAHGNLFDTIFFSSSLGNSRHVKIYTPPAYEQGQNHFPVILFHDGLDYLALADAKNVLDFLIGNDIINPLIAVFVPAINRSEEYHGNLKEEYTEFIITDIMAWVDAKYRTLADPQYRATAGASDGGNISLWIAMNHPESFGKVAAYSSNVIPEISSTFQNEPILNLNIYLDIGTYDIPVLIPMVHNFREILENNGYNLQFYEWNEGHSWGSWRAHIDIALQFFFPHTNSINNRIEDFDNDLLSVYPNPVNGFVTIKFSTESGNIAELLIYDETGKMQESVWKEKSEGNFTGINLDVSYFKPGIYFICLKTGSKTSCRKLLVL